MLRPIQITPITDQTPIRQTLIPNTMSQEQFMANQLAGNNVQLQQPVSPVQGLVASGQEGLQGAERISKQIARSPRVQGLLGGGETAQGLLGDIQGQAALTGLFSTLQAIGRPVRRGEDRFLGAVQYGQQAMNEAQQRGIQDLSTRMKLEEMQRAMDDRQRRSEILAGATSQPAQGQGAAMDLSSTGMFTPFELDQMTEGQRAAANEAVSFQTLADRFTQANMPEEAKQYSELAMQKAENARRNLLTEDKRIDLENKQRTEFSEKEYRPRAEAVSAYNRIAALSERGAGLADYANLIAFIKTLDPTSVVREGEVALAGEFQTLGNRLETIYNKAAEGGFTEQFRRDLVETARRAAEIAAQSYDDAVESQMPVIERQNLRPEQVIVRPTLELAPLPSFAGGEQQQSTGASSVRTIRQRGGVSQ